MRPDYTDPYAAARVSDFMAEAKVGRWQLKHFDVDQATYDRERVWAAHQAGDDEFRREAMLARCVPPGHYISLQRRATMTERRDDERIDLTGGYVPVMSDTPAEIEGHQHAIVYGTGRVLIHGLGLGCLVSSLLAKPDVTHIDVVEVDADVIALTGPYYDDEERVTIHHGDCLHMNWSPEIRWDYVWHDIWTHISDRNLDPERAEHGIAYSTLFDMFRDRCELQGAWAYEEACAMAVAEQARVESLREWEERFWAADNDTKVDMTVEETIRDAIITPDGTPAFPRPEPIPADIRLFFEATNPELRDHIRRRIEGPNFSREDFEAKRARDLAEPLGRPNEEANSNV